MMGIKRLLLLALTGQRAEPIVHLGLIFPEMTPLLDAEPLMKPSEPAQALAATVGITPITATV
jgi:hypothetical protein